MTEGPAERPARHDVEMVVPVRWDDRQPDPGARLDEMSSYLAWLARRVDVTVVDGSDTWSRQRHVDRLGAFSRVLHPESRGANGKVNGAVTGLRAARHHLVIIADDDVRYDDESLADMVQALGAADVVRPQNVFTSWPWHARWDFARSLIARAWGRDWPGTFGVRAGALAADGSPGWDSWDADVLFENLQMWRTAERLGRRTVHRPDLVVGRRPPSTRGFAAQRVRQAYDDLGQPGRLMVELAMLPAGCLLALMRPRALPGAAAATVAVALLGQWRYRRLDVPWDVPLWAPLWLTERAVTVWVAVWLRACRGGIRYHGRRIRAATSLP